MHQDSRNQTKNIKNWTNNDIIELEDNLDESRYPDSGATNHVTNNLSNLNLSNKEYKGNRFIHMGNGESIKITHTENAYIKGEKQLYLNNLLRVPL